MPGVGARDEYQSGVVDERRALGPAVGVGIDVGAEIRLARAFRQVDQHGEAFHTQIGVGLQPETFGVLGVLQPHVAVGEVGAGGALDGAGYGARLEGAGDGGANLEPGVVGGVEVVALVVVKFAFA